MTDTLRAEGIARLVDLAAGDPSLTSPQAIQRFAEAVGALRGWDTFRVNPLAFAEAHGLEAADASRLFVYGAKVGLFTFEWSLLCPLCGGREHSYRSLNQLETETYHCTLCDVDVEVLADAQLEVAFTIPEAQSGFGPDPHGCLEDHWRYYFSTNLVWTPEVREVFEHQPPMRFFALAPGGTASIPVGETPAGRHRLVCVDTHSIGRVALGPRPASEAQRVALALSEGGFEPSEVSLDGRQAELRVRNDTTRTVGLIVAAPDSEAIQAAIRVSPPYFTPFVTGKAMLNDQAFRSLFLMDDLPDDLSLKIRDITLLFTDLKGSTALYDRTGDTFAYKLVRRHFEILQRVVEAHRGGIVKTMGDAIMASFNTPTDGLSAAFRMLEEMDAFHRTLEGDDLDFGLKVGLHRGNVIAVKANQTLDYFGQTVNIAARVQGLAGSGEVWMTDELFGDAGVSALLGRAGRVLGSRRVSLKGVGSLVTVHACAPESGP